MLLPKLQIVFAAEEFCECCYHKPQLYLQQKNSVNAVTITVVFAAEEFCECCYHELPIVFAAEDLDGKQSTVN